MKHCQPGNLKRAGSEPVTGGVRASPLSRAGFCRGWLAKIMRRAIRDAAKNGVVCLTDASPRRWLRLHFDGDRPSRMAIIVVLSYIIQRAIMHHVPYQSAKCMAQQVIVNAIRHCHLSRYSFGPVFVLSIVSRLIQLSRPGEITRGNRRRNHLAHSSARRVMLVLRAAVAYMGVAWNAVMAGYARWVFHDGAREI